MGLSNLAFNQRPCGRHMGPQDSRKRDAPFRHITLLRSDSRSRGCRLDSGQRCILAVDFLGSYDVCQSIGLFLNSDS